VQITDKLRLALDLVDVRVLDHIVVTGEECISMANRGLI
jgi:DNA repair protein RadC